MNKPVDYHPKGGMCACCGKSSDDCSMLDFSKMQKIGSYTICVDKKVTIVKCSEFKRGHNALTAVAPEQDVRLLINAVEIENHE